MIGFKEFISEEVVANSVATGGVDMNQDNFNGFKKRDKRCKYDVEQMYRRNTGLSGIKHLCKK